MRGNRSLLLVFIALVMLATGCRKYNELSSLSSPAYIRVFNMITNTPTIFHNGESNTFLTFLMDPVMDKSNVPQSAPIVGDFLTTRQLFTTSYPTDAANTVVGTGYVNYEYPGREHVLMAPPLNGFECSSWAQITSGKHRIVFLSRPPSSVPFDSLTEVQRSQVIADTTIDFQAGELYTLEAILQDLATFTYAVYARKEDFVHKNYSEDSLYVGFYKVCATIPSGPYNVYSPVFSWFYDSLALSANYFTWNYVLQKPDTVAGGGFRTDTISGRFTSQPKYMVFPAVPQSAFFDPVGQPGTVPWINLSIAPFINLGGYGISFSLNQVSTVGSHIQIYPTVNIMEIVNDRVYRTQVLKVASKIPQ